MHGRDVEVHAEVPVDTAGHSARRDTGSSKQYTMNKEQAKLELETASTEANGVPTGLRK